MSHSDCHIATARRQRRGDVQRVADVEAGDEQRESDDGEADAVPRNRVRDQEDARQEERRSQILLQKEEQQRDANAGRRREARSPRAAR